MALTATASAAQRSFRSGKRSTVRRDWNEAFYNKDVTFIETLLADDFMPPMKMGYGDKAKELALTKAFDQAVESPSG
jgi:hypothetical protein